MTDLNDLANRIETEAPSRELDAEVAKAKGAEDAYITSVSGRAQQHIDGQISSVPHFTTSVDAALSMVPEGLTWTFSWHGHNAAASIFRRNDDGERVTCCKLCVADTPAQAITAAALRAIAGDKS